jgi:hypothetical protein
MGLRYRSRVKIFPGIHLNAGLRSMSVSIGGLTIGSKGTRATVPLGGGFSYTTYAPWRRRRPLTETPLALNSGRPAVRAALTVLEVLYVTASVLLKFALAVGMIGGALVLMCLGAAWDTGRRRRR